MVAPTKRNFIEAWIKSKTNLNKILYHVMHIWTTWMVLDVTENPRHLITNWTRQIIIFGEDRQTSNLLQGCARQWKTTWVQRPIGICVWSTCLHICMSVCLHSTHIQPTQTCGLYTIQCIHHACFFPVYNIQATNNECVYVRGRKMKCATHKLETTISTINIHKTLLVSYIDW